MESIYFVQRSNSFGGGGASLQLDTGVKIAYPNLPDGKRIFVSFIEFNLYTDPVSISTAAEFLIGKVHNLQNLSVERKTVWSGVSLNPDEFLIDIIPLTSFTDEFNQYTKVFQESISPQFSFIYSSQRLNTTKFEITKDDDYPISNVKAIHSVIKLKLSFSL